MERFTINMGGQNYKLPYELLLSNTNSALCSQLASQQHLNIIKQGPATYYWQGLQVLLMRLSLLNTVEGHTEEESKCYHF